MSGPNDSGSGVTAADDFKLTLPEPGSSLIPSERFKLKVAWATPHLEWRPVKGVAQPGGAPPPPPNPEKALDETRRYFRTGMLFDLNRPNWSLVDKAFLTPPTDPPTLMPSVTQIRAWEDDMFYRRLGRAPSLLGAPAPLLTPPLSSPALGSPFYQLPDPSVQAKDSGPPRAGEVGDVLKAFWGLPFAHRLKLQAQDEAERQLRWLMLDWKSMSGWSRVEAITLSAAFVGGALGTVIGVSDVRHMAFKSLLGVELPVPFVPGTSLKLNSFGPFNNALQGPAAPGAPRSNRVDFMITVDVREAVKTIGRYF